MRASFFLLPSLAVVCYSAALPVERDGEAFAVNNEKRQIWLDPFTTTDYATPQSTSSSWKGGEVTITVTETKEVVTTTIYTERSHHHTTTASTPSTPSIVNLDTTISLAFQTFDKRQTFSATLELGGPSETDFLSFYPSETTDGGVNGPYGSWYSLQTDAPVPRN